ncbi:MAG: hypothetical protein Q9220_004882 [cf. Caloplaca sp. 1 TL-2023]
MASHKSHDSSATTELASSPDNETSQGAQIDAAVSSTGPVTSGDFLRLIPANTQARRAFDGVVRLQKAGNLDDLHAQHLQVTGMRPLSHIIDEESDTTSDEGNVAMADSQGQRMLHEGYFRVGFHLPKVSKNPAWIMGRGSGKQKLPARNVDILLAAPGSEDARGLRAAHALLHLHGESGAWLLEAQAGTEVEDRMLDPEEAVPLYHHTTRFSVLDMQYLIRFVVESPEMERSYLEERNRLLEAQGIELPRTSISGIPFASDTSLQSIVFRHGIGSGSFGNVFEGFSPKNGDLRVAKRVTVRSPHEARTLVREIHALLKFNGEEGIVELLDWRNALNSQAVIVSQYPLDVYLVQEKGVSFNHYDWNLNDWNVKRSSARQLLTGLATIHATGCMHRDITQQNILFFPHKDPPEARLCDFGKFCDTKEATDTHLAAWQYLPPELVKGEYNLYGQSLDIWMLGLALTQAWWPQTDKLKPRDVSDHRVMQSILGKEKGEGADLAHLMARMMAWNPAARLSAVQALDHRSLKRVAEAPPIKTSSAKRPHDDPGE